MIAKSSRLKKAIYNIISLGASEVITFIVSLILPRVILSYYGSAYNGLTLSIAQFLKYISVLTLGVAGPTRVVLYKALSNNDSNGVSKIIKATEKFFRKVSLFFLAYVVVLCVALPFIKRYEFAWFETLSLVVIIAIGTFFEYCFGITYKTLLDSDQRMYIYIWIQIFSKIVNLGVSVLLIVNGASIFTAKLFASVCNAITALVIYVFARKKYAIKHDVEPDYSALEQRKDAAASSIANIVHTNTDSFLLTLFSSSALLSVYSVYMLVMGGLESVMKIFTNGLEAAFGNMWAKGEYDSIKKYMRMYELLIYSFTIVAFTCAGILIIPFIVLYTSGIHDINYNRPEFAILLTITTAMFCIRQPYLTMVQAAGKYRETKNGAILEAVLNFSLSFILIHRFDLIGITIGTLVANCIRTFQYAFYMSKNLVNRSIKVTINRMIWAVICSSLIVIASYFMKPILLTDNWFHWVKSGIILAIFSIVTVCFMSLAFYKRDFMELIRFLKRFIKKS